MAARVGSAGGTLGTSVDFGCGLDSLDLVTAPLADRSGDAAAAALDGVGDVVADDVVVVVVVAGATGVAPGSR